MVFKRKGREKKKAKKERIKPRAQVVVPAFIFDVPCKGKMKPIYYRQPLRVSYDMAVQDTAMEIFGSLGFHCPT